VKVEKRDFRAIESRKPKTDIEDIMKSFGNSEFRWDILL
jgi:hypothetical protein